MAAIPNSPTPVQLHIVSMIAALRLQMETAELALGRGKENPDNFEPYIRACGHVVRLLERAGVEAA